MGWDRNGQGTEVAGLKRQERTGGTEMAEPKCHGPHRSPIEALKGRLNEREEKKSVSEVPLFEKFVCTQSCMKIVL